MTLRIRRDELDLPHTQEVKKFSLPLANIPRQVSACFAERVGTPVE